LPDIPETDFMLGSTMIEDDPAVGTVPVPASVEEVPVVDAVVVFVLEAPVDVVVVGGGSIFMPLIWV